MTITDGTAISKTTFEERLLPWQYLAIEWYLGQKWGVWGSWIYGF